MATEEQNDRTFMKNFVITIAVLVGVTVVLIVLAMGLAQLVDDRADQRAELERDRTEQRLQPDGKVRRSGEPAPERAAAADAPADDDDPRAPQDVYSMACAACHDSGAAGAPLKDDADAWASLQDERGFDGLVNSVIDGRGAMPARGGRRDLSDEEIRETVRWMLEEVDVAVQD